MRTGTNGFTNALLSSDTEPVTTVTFAWPAALAVPAAYNTIPDRAVQAFTLQIDLTTDINAETRLITGYPARGGTLTLSGMIGTDESQSAMWFFDPWSTTSPLYGLDWTGIDGPVVTISQGLQIVGAAAPELFSLGNFSVDIVQVDRATGEVILTLLDGRGRLTQVPSLPLVFGGTTNPQPGIAPGLNATWVVDYILRKNTIRSGPAPRTGCIWYESLHGSLWPEVGVVRGSGATSQTLSGPIDMNGVAQPPTFDTRGRWGGLAAHGFSVQQITTGAQFSNAAGYTIAMEASFYIDPAWTPPPSSNLLQLGIGDDGLLAQITFQVQTSASPTPGSALLNVTVAPRNPLSGGLPASLGSIGATGWHDVLVQYVGVSATSFRVDSWIDGVQSTRTITGASLFAASGNTNITVGATDTPGGEFRVDTVELSVGEASPTPSHNPFAGGQVNLDLSLNNLMAIPTTQATDVWGLIQEIASAEFAVFGQDEDGVYYYRVNSNQPTAAGVFVTSRTQISQLMVSAKEAGRARTVQANAHPLGPLPSAVIWSVDHAVKLDPGQTVKVFASLANPVTLIPTTPFVFIPSGGLTAPFASNGYRASRKVDGNGGTVSNLSITAAQIDSNSALITITNPNGFNVFLTNPTAYTGTQAGTPTLSLVGIAAGSTGPTDTTGQPLPGGVVVQSVYGSGVPTLLLPDNVWRQNPAIAQTLTDAMLSETVHPKWLLDQFTILGDPRLQIGDRIRVQDQGEQATNGFGPPAVLDSDLIITGLHPQRDLGFTQQITGRLIGQPRQWVLGQVGKSELGSTTWI